MSRTNKQFLKDVLMSSAKGGAVGYGAGSLLNSDSPLLEDLGNQANFMNRFKVHREFANMMPKEKLPLILAGGMASYNAGRETGNELYDRFSEKVRAKKEKRD